MVPRERQVCFSTIIESKSSDVFDGRASTGSGPFAHLSRDFEQNFGQIVSLRVKTLSHTNLVASGHIKREENLTSGLRVSLKNVIA